MADSNLIARREAVMDEVDRALDAAWPHRRANGVFGQDDGGKVEFHEAYELTTEHIRHVEAVL